MEQNNPVEVMQTAQRLTESIEKAVVGRSEEIRILLTAMLARGHVLLEGAPGTAKTLLGRSLALVSGCSFKRIQVHSRLDACGHYWHPTYTKRNNALFIWSRGQFLLISSWRTKSIDLRQKRKLRCWNAWRNAASHWMARRMTCRPYLRSSPQ